MSAQSTQHLFLQVEGECAPEELVPEPGRSFRSIDIPPSLPEGSDTQLFDGSDLRINIGNSTLSWG